MFSIVLIKLDWVSYFDYPEFVPMTYQRHVYFVDFEDFGRTNPIWFSLVREPIAKFESKCVKIGIQYFATRTFQ